MTLRNKFMPAMLMLGVVAFSSCDKKENESMQPELEQGVISHIMADSAEVMSYNFAGKQLSQVNHYDVESGDLESFEKYERDGKGKLVKSSVYSGKNQALLSEQTFTYDTNGKLTKSNMAYYNGSQLEYSAYATYDYNAQTNNLEKKSVFEGKDTDKEGKLKSYMEFEVLPNGNYTQEKQFVIDDNNEAKLFSTTTYSYDANANPFHTLAEPGSASSPNNLVASTAVVHGSNKTFKYSYSYTYDERGYPLTQTVVTPKGASSTYKYLYSN